MDYKALAQTISNQVQGSVDTAETLAEELRTAKYNKQRIAYLKRLQGMGQLGLTDEEIARANEIGVQPVQAQLREANLRNQMGVDVADVGGGAAAQTALATNDDRTRALNLVTQPIVAANEQARQVQMNELESLAKQPKAGAAWLKAILSQVGNTGMDSNNSAGTMIDSSVQSKGTSSADAESLSAVNQAAGAAGSTDYSSFGEDSGMVSGMMSSFGSF